IHRSRSGRRWQGGTPARTGIGETSPSPSRAASGGRWGSSNAASWDSGPLMNWESVLVAALKRQWKRYRRALKRCKAHFGEKPVHNSRVESRRLMAQLELLGIFAPARLCQRARRALKRHLACFNALRDTQVQLLLLDEPHRARSGATLLRPIWRRREQRDLKRTARDLRDLKTRRLKRLVVSLERQLEASSRDPDRQVRERKAILHAVNTAHQRVLE